MERRVSKLGLEHGQRGPELFQRLGEIRDPTGVGTLCLGACSSPCSQFALRSEDVASGSTRGGSNWR